jgi:hypothetical protein
MPGGPVVEDWCVDFLDHPAFHLHIDLKVNVCGHDRVFAGDIADSKSTKPAISRMDWRKYGQKSVS